MDSAEAYRNQYYGLLEPTSFPFEGCFQLDMRMTPKIQDAVLAQAQEAFDDADPHWAVGPTPNKEVMEIRNKQEKVLDYYDDTEMRNSEDLEGIRHDAFLLGLGWEALVFDRQFIRSREIKNYQNLEQFVADFPNDYNKYMDIVEKLQQGNPQTLKLECNQEWRRSPRRTHVEFEDGIVPLDAKGVEGVNKADIKAIRKIYKWHEIKTMEEEGDFFPGTAEKLKYKPELNKDTKLYEVDPEYLRKDYETFEAQYYIYITENGKKRRVLTLWNVEAEKKVCMRAIRYPYDHNRSFLIPHCIKYTAKGLYQDGIGRMLHDIHLAANATLNQVLNASVLANSLSLKARTGTDSLRRAYEHRWYPGSILELQNMDDVQQFQFGTPNLASLISLFSIIERFGSDATGIINTQLGMESPDDPEAPASKTFALMRKAEIKLRRYIKNLKRSEDEAGYQALRLIYQFIPAKRLSQIVGEDVSDTKDFLKPQIRVVTNASGFAIEKMFEKKDDMQMAMFLMQDPMVQSDPEKRSKLYYTVAASQGSNWDKKIIGIVPTSEEIREMKAKAEEQRRQKRAQVGAEAAKQAMAGGASPQEAQAAGQSAIKKFEALQANAQATQQAEQKGRKK